MAGVQVPQNPRIKGWDPSDVERLLPVEMKLTDAKVSNFIINQVFLMIEQHSQAGNKKIKTVNSDVHNNMAKLSMEVFSKCKYGEIYGDILTANIILCPVLHGDHWCLLVIQLKDKRMVYLDSLLNGIGAQTSFSRFTNFLQCMAMYHQLSTNWLGWEFYSIPSSEIAQQTTYVDCGVLVIKWAQHLAEGRPLDFSQMQINDFRYSLILDIAKGTLSVLSSEPKHEAPSLPPTPRLKKGKIGNGSFENAKQQPQQQSSIQQKQDTISDVSDVSVSRSTKLRTGKTDKQQKNPHHSSSNVSSLKTVKTNNRSFTSVTQQPQQQPQSDTDSDFESPRKRVKKQVPKEESLKPTPEKNCASPPVHQGIHNDHSYAEVADDTCTLEFETNSQIPHAAKQVLPPGYSYKCLEFQELPSECFTGAPQESVYVKVSVGNITSKEDIEQWLHQFSVSSNIKYNAHAGYRRKGVKVLYARWYICHCKRKKLTKKQAMEKEAARKRKEKRYGTHKENIGDEENGIHLLSKTRDTKTDCDSKMAIRIYTKKQLSELCKIELWRNHNHSVDCFHLTSFCPILPATKDKFSSYFAQGMSASEAFHHHETQLMRDPVTLMLLADRRICPSLRDVSNMYEKWLIENKGPSNGPEMFDRLETLVQEYNKKHAEVRGKCFLQRYKNDGGYEQHLVLSIYTSLMSRVHKTRQASEMAFMDCSGSLDQHNNPVFFMCTHHPCGALPLAVWATSSQSEASLESCLESLKSILPSHTFGNQGPETGPDVFMTDDDTAQRQALRSQWKHAALLLCIFHFMQATWRWLLDSKHSVSKDDRALRNRSQLRTRGNNTYNYTESMIFVFKCVVLRRMRAYNLIELFHFITEDLEMYFQWKLLSLAFGKPQTLHLAARCSGRNASSVNLNSITKDDQSPF